MAGSSARRLASFSSNSCTRLRTSRVFLPKRSNLTTMRTSEGRIKSRIDASSLRSFREPPEIVSVRMSVQPAALSLPPRWRVLSRVEVAGVADQVAFAVRGRIGRWGGFASLRCLRWFAGGGFGGLPFCCAELMLSHHVVLFETSRGCRGPPDRPRWK
jgi:hypothetical protein